MALIEFKVNLDANNNIAVEATVLRVDPGDEVVLVTSTPNTALRFNPGSPFAAPAAEKIYLLPKETPSEPIQVTKSADLSQVAECGEADGAGNFAPWVGGFPNGGGTNKPIIGGGGI
jgi:hypothetical protein